MPVASKEQIRKQLKQEVSEIITDAIRALEKGQSTTYARTRLQDIERRLIQLEFEYKGGCLW